MDILPLLLSLWWTRHLQIRCYFMIVHNNMRKSDPWIYKYWVTYSRYFRIVITVALGMGIADRNLLFFMAFQSKVRTCQFQWENTTIEQFMNPSTINFHLMLLDHIWIYITLPLIIFPAPQKSWYTSDPLPAAISVTSGNYVSILTTPSDSPQLLVLYSDDTETQHTTMSDNPFHISMKGGYCLSFHDWVLCAKSSSDLWLQRTGFMSVGTRKQE